MYDSAERKMSKYKRATIDLISKSEAMNRLVYVKQMAEVWLLFRD